MTTQFEEVKQRLEKAQNDVRWLLAVLDDPWAACKAYDLTEEEVDQLFNEAQAVCSSVDADFQRLQNQSTDITLGNHTIELAGPIPPSWRVKLDIHGPAIQGEIPPWKRKTSNLQPPTSGEVPPWDEEEILKLLDKNSKLTWNDLDNLSPRNFLAGGEFKPK
jgi:hypothetical protein